MFDACNASGLRLWLHLVQQLQDGLHISILRGLWRKDVRGVEPKAQVRDVGQLPTDIPHRKPQKGASKPVENTDFILFFNENSCYSWCHEVMKRRGQDAPRRTRPRTRGKSLSRSGPCSRPSGQHTACLRALLNATPDEIKTLNKRSEKLLTPYSQ